MDFELSADQEELRDTARAFLDKECSPEFIRGIFEGSRTGEDLWSTMVELYWPALQVPEAMGGLGLSFIELAVIVTELGRVLAPGPFLSTVTQFLPFVMETAQPDAQRRLIADVIERGRTGTVAFAEQSGDWRPASVRLAASAHGDVWRLNGQKSFVFDGLTADEVVVIARADGGTDASGLGVFVVSGDAISRRAMPVIDRTQPLADLMFREVEVPPDRVLLAPGDDASGAVSRGLEQATVALAVSTVATCRVIFETTLQYAKDRQQFGRPIGSFQALKHRLADLYLAVERAAALCDFAVLAIAENDERRAIGAAMAKAGAGDCQRLVVRDGLQLHGGIGMAWEYDLHFFLKRAKTNEGLFGTSAAHRAQVAEVLELVPA